MTTIYTGLKALQTALFNALTADSAIKSLVGDPARVYDNVPQDATYPLIVIGEGSEVDDSYFGQLCFEDTIEIQSWATDSEETTSNSGAAGYKTVHDIAEAVAAVVYGSLSVTGFDVIVINRDEQHGERVAVTDTLLARCMKQTFRIRLEAQ